MKRVVLVLLPVILFPAMLRAQSGTALFLVLPVDARVAGSGGGGIALPADAFSIFRAPAALSLDASRDGAGITRAACLPALLPGGYLDAAAVAFRVSGRGGVAAGFRHRSYPRAEGRDGDAMPTGTMHPAEWAAEVAYAHRLPAGLGVSVTTRYARLYAARSRDVFSFDAGMCYREPFFSMPGGSWAIAFHAGNLAGRVSRDVFLPARATLGGAIALPAAGGMFSGCVDLAYTFFPARDAHLETATGVEFSSRRWALRAGYRDGGGDKGMDSHASVGCSARVAPLACHLAYWITAPSSPLKNTWLLSLDFSW